MACFMHYYIGEYRDILHFKSGVFNNKLLKAVLEKGGEVTFPFC